MQRCRWIAVGRSLVGLLAFTALGLSSHPLRAQMLTEIAPRQVLTVDGVDAGGADRAAVVSAVALDGAGRRVASVGDDHMLRLWRLDDGQIIYQAPLHADWIRAVAIRPDGQRLATAGDDRRVRFWDMASQTPAIDAPSYPEAIMSLAYSPDGALLAVGGFANEVRLVDGNDGRLLRVLSAAGSDVRTVRFSPDGSMLAVAGRPGQVRLFDVASGSLRADLDAGSRPLQALAFSPDGQTLACGGQSRTVHLFATTGAPLAELPAEPGAVTALAFCGPQTLAVGRSDNSLRLWDLASRTAQAALTGATGTVTTLTYNDETGTLLSGGFDTKIRVYSLK